MKIGVVGSGIAGLVTAWLLSRSNKCDVVLFEKNALPGMSGAGVRCDSLPEEIDVPLRLFNSRQWPLLSNLYAVLGIELEPVSVSQSFADQEGRTYFQIDLDSLFGTSLSDLLGRRSRRILQQAQQLRRTGLKDLEKLAFDQSFDQYLDSRQFEEEFKNEFLYPILASTVCTCSIAALRNYPARFVLGLMANITSQESGRPNLFRAQLGSGQVSARLLDSVNELRAGAAIEKVVRHSDRVQLKVEDCPEESFDHVVIASQADQALKLLECPSVLEKEMLGSFQYENVEVVVHSDDNFMPLQTEKWQSFNFQTSTGAHGEPLAMCSIWLNEFSKQYSGRKNVFQTITPFRRPAPSQTIAVRRLNRPIVTASSFAGWQKRADLHSEPDRRIWFAGSFASPGVPLLETGVKSALEVVGRLGVDTEFLQNSLDGKQIAVR